LTGIKKKKRGGVGNKGENIKKVSNPRRVQELMGFNKGTSISKAGPFVNWGGGAQGGGSRRKGKRKKGGRSLSPGVVSK